CCARRLWNESFFSAPQLKRDALGGPGVTSYLLRAQHVIALPVEVRPSPREVADWLERTMGSDSVEVTRVGETVLEFRSRFALVEPYRSGDGLALLANGEI